MNYPAIGYLLKDARAQSGYTLTAAAKELQINKSTLSRLENHPGYVLTMSAIKLIQICNLYQRSFITISGRGSAWRSRFKPGGIVVLVDDERTQLLIFQALLKRHFPGQQFLAFADSKKAANWLKTNKARLVLTDYRMRPIDGGELLKRMTKTELNRYTPAIMMTDKNELDIIRKIAKQQNAVFYNKRQKKFALVRLVRDILVLV